MPCARMGLCRKNDCNYNGLLFAALYLEYHRRKSSNRFRRLLTKKPSIMVTKFPNCLSIYTRENSKSNATARIAEVKPARSLPIVGKREAAAASRAKPIEAATRLVRSAMPKTESSTMSGAEISTALSRPSRYGRVPAPVRHKPASVSARNGFAVRGSAGCPGRWRYRSPG